jgi:hypothetical protein
MIMIGCDFHPGLQELCLLDTETGRRREQWLSHDLGPAPVRQFYAALPRPARVGLEASGYSQWYEEMLGRTGHRAASLEMSSPQLSSNFPKIFIPREIKIPRSWRSERVQFDKLSIEIK